MTVNARKTAESDRLRILLRILLVVILISIGGHLLAMEFPTINELIELVRKGRLHMGYGSLLLLSLALTILVGIPFVPAIHLAIVILVIYGNLGALHVLLGTVLGLSISFFVGRHMPERLIMMVYNPHIHKLDLDRWVGGNANKYFDRLSSWVRLIPFRWRRALGLVVLLNIPGNTLFGDGGGISIICGMDRRYHFWEFLLTITIASLPLPLAFALGALKLEYVMKVVS